MEVNSPVDHCDIKMGLRVVQQHISERQESHSSTSSAEQNSEQYYLQTIHLAKGAKEADILKAAAAVTNGVSSVILEGIDTSALFPHGVNRDGSITVEWEGSKNGSIQEERNGSEGSVLLSQAQTLIDLFHELFRNSSTPLQIVLEPQESGELVCLEQKSNNAESNLSQEEINIRDCKEMMHPQDALIKNDVPLNDGKETSSRHVSIMENSKQSETLSTVQLIHRCYYCSFGSERVSVVMEHVRSHHPSRPVRTKTISGRNCPYCCVRLEQTAFFHHMRQCHGDAHPFRCGYCSFMGRDLNRVKHHCSKKHHEKPFKCFRRTKALSSHSNVMLNVRRRLKKEECAADNEGENNLCRTEDTKKERNVFKDRTCVGDENDEEEDIEEVESSENKFHCCPVCQRKIKTLKYLKVHMRVHSRGRYKCGYCSYLSVYFLQALQHCKKRHRLLQPKVKRHELDPSQNKSVVKNIDKFMEEILKKCSRQPPDPDARKWARKYSCPHCEYTCGYGASYRRHLTTHTTSPFPFRCKYCSFEGREKYYVRRHIQRIHRGLPAVVVENCPQKSLDRDMEDCLMAGEEKELCDIAFKKEAASQVIRTKAISKDEGKPIKGAKRPELDNLKKAVSSSSEMGQEEGKLESEMKKVRESVSKDKDVTHSSEEVSWRREETTNMTGEFENILRVEVTPDSEMMRDEGEVTSRLVTPRTSREHLDSILQKPKPKKLASKKQLRKSLANCRTCNGNKGKKILPKGGTSDDSSISLKLDANARIGSSSTEGHVPDELCTENGAVCVSLEGLLQGVEKDKDFVDTSDAVKSKRSVIDDIGGEGEKVQGCSKVKAGKIKANCRKKGKKEKSTHRVWDFVAFRDGKHTYCVCGARTVNKAFYKHIKKHTDSKPFGCGYCSYRSIERAKVRVHHTFVHPGLPVSINETEENVKGGLEKGQTAETNQNTEIDLNLNEVAKSGPQLVTKKNSTTRSQVSIDFQCPICSKRISYHTYTIRRHFFSHYEYRPYQCGRCDFRGCSPGEVKQHSVYHGADLCPIVIPSGQEPPEGLEQLVADCFKEMRIKLGKKTRKSQKTNGPKVNDHSIREDPLPSGYQLVTREAISWHDALSQGECPWCKREIHSSAADKRGQLLQESEIKNHFKSHFYKPIEDSSAYSSRPMEAGTVLMDLPGSPEEKDAIVMNGLMYYFIHRPLITEPDSKEFSQGKGSTLESGETGIISCPDGMPQGTIQITDFLLADLRYLLWGQELEAQSRKSRSYACHKCNLNFESAATLQLHGECHEPCDSQQPGTKEVLHSSPYPLWDVADAPNDSQVPDTEVGVLLLGDEMEMTTAVVVVNPEAGEHKAIGMEMCI